jgi:hypothetical protein
MVNFRIRRWNCSIAPNLETKMLVQLTHGLKVQEGSSSVRATGKLLKPVADGF